ncbi:MAG: hypothetical protein LW707_10340 [Sphingobacteriales bacterium]|nr:hypothetical protein [Sphingobacteriales bacterium]
MKRAGIILLLTCGFLLQSRDVSAQRIIVKNLEKYDRQWIHFGFLLGYNKTNTATTASTQSMPLAGRDSIWASSPTCASATTLIYASYLTSLFHSVT